MIVKQIKLSKMDTFCYLVGDRKTKTCALIDPAFDTPRILDIAAGMEFEVSHVINTHCHSDHTAGNRAIVDATGAKLLIHAIDAERLKKILNSTFSHFLGGRSSPKPDVLLQDNDRIDIGATCLKTIHTPRAYARWNLSVHRRTCVYRGQPVCRGCRPHRSSRRVLRSVAAVDQGKDLYITRCHHCMAGA